MEGQKEIDLAGLTIIEKIVEDKNFKAEMLNGILKKMPKFLKHSDDEIVGKCLKVLTKIIQGSPKHTTAIMKANIFPLIIQNLEHKNFTIQDSAALVLSSAMIQGSAVEVSYLVDQNIIQEMCKVLQKREKYVQTVAIIIGGYRCIVGKVENRNKEMSEIFESCGAMKIFDRLKYHENEMIRNYALKLIEICYESNYIYVREEL